MPCLRSLVPLAVLLVSWLELTSAVNRRRRNGSSGQGWITVPKEETYRKDCWEIKEHTGSGDGVQYIWPEGASHPVRVTCQDGYTVIIKRVTDDTSFNRSWAEYKRGFGNPGSDFWLGNQMLHHLTTQKRYMAKIVLQGFDSNENMTALYRKFSVGPEASGYRLRVSGYTGTAGNGLRSHRGRPFGTTDRVAESSRSCPRNFFGGGWWYSSCGVSLTGPLNSPALSFGARARWWKRGDSRQGEFFHIRFAVVFLAPREHYWDMNGAS